MDVLFVFGAVTAIGTAILTVGSVWKLLMQPMSSAIESIKESVLRLESRVESNEAKRESDIKDLWKFLAEREAQE